ncbi:hypothetical protein DFH08DRAFT_1002932 [Mycena albidolilacea]|uniref:Uncharacterized protein n=1 Tax=Mycena albidolilacea TaxID=1033008 RepID=A0AAD7AQM9_9AGAR|nr:hypothetical protein DFH08DRAFT_1002932 [Mycena albidolilacea]
MCAPAKGYVSASVVFAPRVPRRAMTVDLEPPLPGASSSRACCGQAETDPHALVLARTYDCIRGHLRRCNLQDRLGAYLAGCRCWWVDHERDGPCDAYLTNPCVPSTTAIAFHSRATTGQVNPRTVRGAADEPYQAPSAGPGPGPAYPRVGRGRCGRLWRMDGWRAGREGSQVSREDGDIHDVLVGCLLSAPHLCIVHRATRRACHAGLSGATVAGEDAPPPPPRVVPTMSERVHCARAGGGEGAWGRARRGLEVDERVQEREEAAQGGQGERRQESGPGSLV